MMRIELGGPRWGNDAGWWFLEGEEEREREESKPARPARRRSGAAVYLI